MVYQPLYVTNVETSWTHAIVFGRMHNEHKENCKIFYNLQTNSREVRRYVLCSYIWRFCYLFDAYQLCIWLYCRLTMQDVFFFSFVKIDLMFCWLGELFRLNSQQSHAKIIIQLSCLWENNSRHDFSIFENQSFTLL